MADVGLVIEILGPENQGSRFLNTIKFPDLWTCRQDDQLVNHNQGFCFHRSCEQVQQVCALHATKG
jgi:hypothetical protein